MANVKLSTGREIDTRSINLLDAEKLRTELLTYALEHPEAAKQMPITFEIAYKAMRAAGITDNQILEFSTNERIECAGILLNECFPTDLDKKK